MGKKTLFADVSLLLVALVWGATFVLVQNAISFLEPFSFNAVRFMTAAILLGGWLVLFQRKQFKEFSPKLIVAGIFIGIWLFLGYAFQTLGLLYTTSSKAGFITGLSVVMVPIFSILILRQKLSLNAICGVAVATIGLYLLTMTDISSLNIGDGFVFLCAIAFALHIITTGKFSGLYPALLLTVIQITTVALLSFFFAFLLEDWQNAFRTEILFSKQVFIALFITAVFATALAFFAQTTFQKYTTATRVALIFAMEPVFAAATGFLYAGERLSYSALAGCVLIFSGMIFAELPSRNFNVFKKMKKKFAA